MSLEPKDCRWPWNRLYVHVDGDIKPCCYSLFNVGNIATTADLDTVWNGTKMSRLREAVKANRIDPLCAGAGCAYVRSRIPDDIVKSGTRFRGHIPDDLTDESTRKLARLGHDDALFRVGYGFYMRGHMLRATLWLERAVKLGNVTAMYILGYHYCSSRWKSVTGWRGRQLLGKACDKQYPAAFVALGLEYHVQRRYLKALDLFKRGAECNEADCFYWLSVYTSLGIGTSKNLVEAKRLLDLAARRGSKSALALAKS